MCWYCLLNATKILSRLFRPIFRLPTSDFRLPSPPSRLFPIFVCSYYHMATVLITGGTGLIGTALTETLVQKGYDVIVLTRKLPEKGQASNLKIRYAQWDIAAQTIDTAAVQAADYIVHLAGANVAQGRWTETRKKEIVSSRVRSGQLLVKALSETPNKVRAVVASSAIGWYGPDPQVPNPRPFLETDSVDGAFLGRTCKQWEDSITPVAAMGKRLVIFRTGIVLSTEGGAYKEFKKPLQFGIAGILGSGKQVVSWIHIADIVGLYVTALEQQQWQGVYNAVAPNPVSNKELVLAMAAAKDGIAIPAPVPEFALKIALGEMSIEVLKSATVSSAKAQKEGYTFIFPEIGAATRNLEGK